MDTSTLWQNGEYALYVATSEENAYIPLSSRTADDFELSAGCRLYVIERIRAQMLISQGNAKDAHVEIYADSGVSGPAGISPHPEEDWKRYAFTFETPALTLPPGHHWLSVFNVDAPGSSQQAFSRAYFAMTAYDSYRLQPAH